MLKFSSLTPFQRITLSGPINRKWLHNYGSAPRNHIWTFVAALDELGHGNVT